MVQQGDFVVQLVEANSRNPFKEHYHRGKTYVEVEPGEEYFIAISKPRADQLFSDLCVESYVDGKYLGYCSLYTTASISSQHSYKGCFSYNNGTATHRALKFVIPKIRGYESTQNKEAGMGKVDITISQATNPRRHVRKSVQAVSVSGDIGRASEKNKKAVRSSSGSCEVIRKTKTTMTQYDRGILLSTITLYYCTTPGLVQMGVIPAYNPEHDDQAATDVTAKEEKKSHQKRSFSVASATSDESDDDTLVFVQPRPKSIKIVDLTGCDSDDK